MSDNYLYRPPALRAVSPDFDWDRAKIWSLDLPAQDMPLDQLLWHFDLPFWEKEGTDDWNLTPWEVIRHPESEPSHAAKIQAADLSYPLDVILLNGRYRVLDGLHRLAKAYQNGEKSIRVRVVPPEMFEQIQDRTQRYLIAFVLRDSDKDKLDALRREISDKFNVAHALRWPPHITLYYPFETEEKLECVQEVVAKCASSQASFSLNVLKYEHFGDKVWFIDVEQKKELFALSQRIEVSLKETLNLSEIRTWEGRQHYHLTLAAQDLNAQSFADIEEFLRNYELPIQTLNIDSMTLFQYHESAHIQHGTFPFSSIILP